jgi:hypothetical protein
MIVPVIVMAILLGRYIEGLLIGAVRVEGRPWSTLGASRIGPRYGHQQ